MKLAMFVLACVLAATSASAQPAPGLENPGGPGRSDLRTGEPPRDISQTRARGARFLFQHGPNRIAIRCADNEPTKDCIEAANFLIDKVMNEISRRRGDDDGYDRRWRRRTDDDRRMDGDRHMNERSRDNRNEE